MLPFLSTYDPPGSSEGTLDPLGLYTIADQLAVQLVPAVRERMQRARFLTAMTVGSWVTEGLVEDPSLRDASPTLAWEWLVVEALLRSSSSVPDLRGVPGTQVARRSLEQHGSLSANGYLKTPRIFGFHGVYKRLAIHLGLLDVHLNPGPQAEGLIDAWARDQGLGNASGARAQLDRWRKAVERSLAERPPRTKTGWPIAAWEELAKAFAPGTARARERRYLRELLLGKDSSRLGAFPLLWELQEKFPSHATFTEEALHHKLGSREPAYQPLLAAIRAYEDFARGLQDGFNVLRQQAARADSRGFQIPTIAGDEQFFQSIQGLNVRFASARTALAEEPGAGTRAVGLFEDRFGTIAEAMEPGEVGLALCSLHERVQQGKSAAGKRPWFDRLGPDRIFLRHGFREVPEQTFPGRYVHDYRGWPVRRFWEDLQ